MASLKKRNNTWYAVWYQNGKQIARTTNVPVKGPKAVRPRVEYIAIRGVSTILILLAKIRSC